MDELTLLRSKGIELAKKGYYNEAYGFFKAAIDKGDVAAMNDLGVNYERAEDYESAFCCYMNASENGNGMATCNLGNMYEKGLGVKKNYKMAVKYYESASDKGECYAFYKLSVFYRHGIGIKKDEKKSLSLCLKGAKLEKKTEDESNCISDLSYYYENGIGCKPNKKKAYKWAKESAKRGNDIGIYNLSECYLYGKGTRKNIKKGLQLLFVAVEHDYPDAFFRLSELYEEGFGVKKDKVLSEIWLTESMNNQSLKGYLKFIKIRLSKENEKERQLDLVTRVIAMFILEVDCTYLDEIDEYQEIKKQYRDVIDWDDIEVNASAYAKGEKIKVTC